MDGKYVNDTSRVLDDLEKQVASEPARHSEEEKASSESVLGNVKDSATRGVQVLSDKAVELSQDAKERLKETVISGREVLSATLEDTSRAVRQVAEGESPLIASLKPYTERIGAALDETSDYLNSVTLQRLVKDTRTLAKNNPAVFVGGAMVLGLVAARFLKSTSSVEKEA